VHNGKRMQGTVKREGTKGAEGDRKQHSCGDNRGPGTWGSTNTR